MIEINNPKEYFHLQTKLPDIPFTQSEGWHIYQKSKGNKIRYFVNDLSDIRIAFWGIEKKIPIIGKKLFIVEGESIYPNLDDTIITAFFKQVKELNYKAILINSNNHYSIGYEIGMRRAGFIRPLGFFSCPLTIINKIQDSPKYNRNWKRNIKTAINSNLEFSEIIFPEKTDIESFIIIFEEMSDLKNLSYKLSINHLYQLINQKCMRLFVVKNNQKPIAARIINLNGKIAYDVYAANSLEARKTGASYFIMQSIFEVLKIEGVEQFDFGRIPPSNNTTDNVYVFKKASGGLPIQYNGEWVYFKNKTIEILFTLHQLFKLKKQRY